MMTSFPRRIVAAWIVIVFQFLTPPSLTTTISFYGGMVGVVFNSSIFLTWRPERLSWEEAKRNCRSKGGSLVSIKSDALNRFIFESFFRETVLKTPGWQREWEFSSERRKPPTRSGLSAGFHKYEAWVNGIRTQKLDGELEWFWVRDSMLKFRRFGQGYSDSTNWNCLSVKPGFVDKIPEGASSYDLFWYGSKCRTALPYICQFVTSRKMRMETSKVNIQRVKATSDASCQLGLLGWNRFIVYLVAFVFANSGYLKS